MQLTQCLGENDIAVFSGLLPNNLPLLIKPEVEIGLVTHLQSC